MLKVAILVLFFLSFVSAQCSDGSDCTCTQCNLAGYTYWCSDNSNCYSTEFTCDLGCGSSSNCVSTATCTIALTCTTDQASQCSSDQTCCLDQDGNPFCAQGSKMKCCSYGTLACPATQVCDPAGGGCKLNPPDNSGACTACQAMISHIESDGCSDACDLLPPPADVVCNFAMDQTDLCNTIIQYIEGGFTPYTICEMIPFIPLCQSNVTCDCGYCIPAVYGQWCLSLPNSCPSSKVEASKNNTWHRKEKTGARSNTVFGSQVNGTNVCLDGTCDESNAGCCLTCAP